MPFLFCLSYISIFKKKEECFTIPEESPLRPILDKWSDYSYELMSGKGLGRVILGACAPYTVSLAVWIMLFVVSCVTGTYKTPKKKPGLFRVFSFSFGYFVSFCSVPFLHFSQVSLAIFKTSTDVKWQKETREKQTTVPKGEKKAPPWLLKSPKTPSQNWAWLVDSRAKRHPFNG